MDSLTACTEVKSVRSDVLIVNSTKCDEKSTNIDEKITSFTTTAQQITSPSTISVPIDSPPSSKQERNEIQPTKPLDKRYSRTMELSIFEGGLSTVSLVTGDIYLVPYALYLHATPAQIGIMGSLVGLIAPIGQIFGSAAMKKISRKTIMWLFALLQAVMWIGIMGAGIMGYFGLIPSWIPWLVMGVYALFHFFNGMATPPWVSIMGEIVPDDRRGRFFGIRNLISTAASIVVVVSAAFGLNWFQLNNLEFIGFMIIFGIAFLNRFTGSIALKYHHNPPFQLQKKDYVSFWQFTKGLKTENFGLFTLMMAFLYLALFVAGPFFSVYMLEILHYDYPTYILINLSTGVISLFVFPFVGKFADKYGNLALLTFGAFLIPLPPILWAFFTNPWGIFFGVQIISGIGWSAFNLAAGNFIFDNIPISKRGIYIAYYNFLVGIGTIVGGLIGSGLMIFIPLEISFRYKSLFVLSGILRVLFLAIFIPKLKEVRVLQEKPIYNVKSGAISRWLYEIILLQKRQNGKSNKKNGHNPESNNINH